MLFFYSIIFGIVQGLTEFIPVSSTGHLVILHSLLNFNFANNLGFDVFLHFGTLLALLVFFFKDISKYFMAFLDSLVSWNIKEDINQKISWQIILATVPAVILGYFFEEKISNIFRSNFSVAIMLILVGLIFFYSEKYSQKTKEIKELSWTHALMIGIFQALALVPGVSRSGITIIAGLESGLKRVEAAKFSFLMAVPIILIAGIKGSIDLFSAGINSNEIIIYVLGLVSSFIAGILAIKYFLKFLEKYSLIPFAVYRIALGVIILIFLAF